MAPTSEGVRGITGTEIGAWALSWGDASWRGLYGGYASTIWIFCIVRLRLTSQAPRLAQIAPPSAGGASAGRGT